MGIGDWGLGIGDRGWGKGEREKKAIAKSLKKSVKIKQHKKNK